MCPKGGWLELYIRHMYEFRIREGGCGFCHWLSSWRLCLQYGPLTKCVTSRVALAPGMCVKSTCVKNVSLCISGSLTSCGGENVPGLFRRMHNPQLYIFGKRSMVIRLVSFQRKISCAFDMIENHYVLVERMPSNYKIWYNKRRPYYIGYIALKCVIVVYSRNICNPMKQLQDMWLAHISVHLTLVTCGFGKFKRYIYIVLQHGAGNTMCTWQSNAYQQTCSGTPF